MQNGANIRKAPELKLNIGASLVSTFLNGHVRSLGYYPTRLTNAQLQAITV